MPEFAFDRTPESPDELWWAVQHLWGVTIPRERICEDHVAPFEAFSDAFFGVDSISVPGEVTPSSTGFWHGSRGLSGKSYMMSALGMAMASFLGCRVNLLGGSFAQSKNIKEHMESMRFSPHAPERQIETWGAEEVALTNGAKIKPLTASQKTVRGPHPQRLLLDEIDEMEEKILHAALGQPMERVNKAGELILPYSVMCSTWQNPDGTFTHTLQLAEERKWPIYRWCYRESHANGKGWLSQRQIDEKKHTTPAEMWRVEYELGEPAIGNRAFDEAAIDAVFCLPAPEPVRLETDLEEYVIAEPERGRKYVVAADWGKEQDRTVIGVLDVTNPAKRKLVYFLACRRRPYPVMVGYFNAAINKYSPNRGKAIHDGTGVGNMVNDYVDQRAWGFKFTGESKAAIATEYVSGVEQVAYELPRIPSMYTEHKYCRVGDLYSTAQQYHLPDTVSMMAMAHKATGRAHNLQPGKGVGKRDPNTPETWMGTGVGDGNTVKRVGEVTSPGEVADGFSLFV